MPSGFTTMKRLRSLLPRERYHWETPKSSDFLDAVWKQCSSSPYIYQSVASLLSTSQFRGKGESNTPLTIQYLVDALGSYPDLMLRYAAFLPRGDTFRFADDYEKTRVVYVTSAGNMVPRAAFGLIRVTSVDPVVADRHIKSFLYTVFFVDQNREDALLTLQGGDAGRALDIMKELDENETTWDRFSGRQQAPDKRDRVFRLMGKLAVASRQFPPSLCINNIILPRFATAAGGFGDVYKGTWKHKAVAVKTMKKSETSSDIVAEIRKMFFREALNWWQCRHEHVVPLLGVYPSEISFLGFSLVLPWMEWGNLGKCAMELRKHRRAVPIDRWLYEIADGLGFLHSKSIVHGDLRACNVLINDRLQVQLTDFGLSIFASRANTSSLHIHGGNVRWMAPEQMGPPGAMASPSMDVYSFASLCIEFYTNASPFREMPKRTTPNDRIVELVRRGVRPTRPTALGEKIPDDLWAIMVYCWNHDPSQRPTALNLRHELKRRLNSR